jgi:hypothetical protein
MDRCVRVRCRHPAAWPDRRRPQGTLYYDAERLQWYKGDWSHGLRHGNGELCNGTQTYVGEWSQDRKRG